MTIMDTTQEEALVAMAPLEKKTKKKILRKLRAARPAPAKKLAPADGIYTGLTVHDCCTACNAQGCVISGKSYCAHPRKGGLHAAEQQSDAALKRRRDAEKVLGKLKLVVE